MLENVYRLQIMNTTEQPRRFVITASGIDGLKLIAQQPVAVPAAGALTLPVALRIDSGATSPGSHPVLFHVEDGADARIRADEKSVFYVR